MMSCLKVEDMWSGGGRVIGVYMNITHLFRCILFP